jgi:two-component system chemotaxis sensor kinase CheA
MSSNEDEILLGSFIEESVEHLADIGDDLLVTEQGGAGDDEERVNTVFRSIHSIKGGAGFLGLYGLQNLTRATENVLGLVRTCKLMPTPEVINTLLLASDRIKQLLANVSCSNEIDISDPVAALHSIASGDRRSPPLPPETRPTAEEAMASLSPKDDIPPSDNVMITRETETSIRVSVGLLDQLMTLAGELMLSRNQLLQTINSGAAPEAEAVGQRIDLVTSELQGAIMLTRIQPIGNVPGKFPRVVRDLAKKLGKEVELDKTIIDGDKRPAHPLGAQ